MMQFVDKYIGFACIGSEIWFQKRRSNGLGGLACTLLLVIIFGLEGCTPGQLPVMNHFDIVDFAAVHSPVAGKVNKYLIFGNVEIAKPAANLPPELVGFLGRWEGYSYSLPAKRERKVVLVIEDINTTGGKLVFWSGANLQYPDVVGEVLFRVVQGHSPAIQWQISWPDGSQSDETFSYIPKKKMLEGWSKYLSDNHTGGPFELTRNEDFTIYKDYPQYLAGKNIYAAKYNNSALGQYGAGYLYYLPSGYRADAFKTWPLLLFLHGKGYRGENIFSLANDSPFTYVQDQNPLPFIIVAPLLSTKTGADSFPDAYLDGVLAEIRANFRVDPKRIYMTGVNMGGEATWRFALHQPATFAAIAPLSAYLDQIDPQAMKNIVTLPVWAFHGAEDPLILPARGQQPVDALKAVGGNVRFSLLDGHDHNVWTDTYGDPAFYDWLLDQQRP